MTVLTRSRRTARRFSAAALRPYESPETKTSWLWRYWTGCTSHTGAKNARHLPSWGPSRASRSRRSVVQNPIAPTEPQTRNLRVTGGFMGCGNLTREAASDERRQLLADAFTLNIPPGLIRLPLAG